MRPHLVADLVHQRLTESPALALTGPRQAGKTTAGDEQRAAANLGWAVEQLLDGS